MNDSGSGEGGGTARGTDATLWELGVQLLHTLLDLSSAYRTDTDPSTDRVGTDPSTDRVGTDASSLGGGSTIDASSLGVGAAATRRGAARRRGSLRAKATTVESP